MAHVKPRETLEQDIRKATLTANPGELDANLTMLLFLSEEDFLGKKVISTEISLGKCQSLV